LQLAHQPILGRFTTPTATTYFPQSQEPTEIRRVCSTTNGALQQLSLGQGRRGVTRGAASSDWSLTIEAAIAVFGSVAFLALDSATHRRVKAGDDRGTARRYTASQRITTLAVRLNHTIVAARDKDDSAKFLTKMLGLPAPLVLGPFAVVRVGDDTSLDYVDADGEITPQHYAFLVSEIEFDEIFGRFREQRRPYWADPRRQEREQINAWDDGRGVYFDDPNGHLLEIITRPYGSGGTAASRPHPLVARILDPGDHEGGGRSSRQQNGGGKLAVAEHPTPRDAQ
jgi:catechol 2,3-dioxygenase-like lactoylglutathione lyase family enzyme